jgi:PBSX family phage portal protein
MSDTSVSPDARPAGKRQRKSKATKEPVRIAALREFSDKKQFADPFMGNYTVALKGLGNIILQPPYNYGVLLRLPKENNTLRQCIDSMITNTVGHGYTLSYVGPDGQEETDASKKEKEALNNLLTFPNENCSLIQSLEMAKQDKYTIGSGYLEIGRDSQGRIAMISHIPAHTVRRTTRDEKPTSFEVNLPRDGKIVAIKSNKRFCRYVQTYQGNFIYFKEFGDPRSIDPETGEENPALGLQQQATEIIEDSYYNPGDAYGLPPWIGQMPSVLGSREAELSNMDFFKENTIPALAILVGGGSVTEGSMDKLEEVMTAVRGRQSMNRIVFIEAEPDTRLASSDGVLPAPKLEIKSLAGERQQEGAFLDYDKDCRDKIRSAFRLPPVFTGMTGDYTFASAKTSFEVAEDQVFGPERRHTDDMVNNKIISTWKPQFWAFRLQPARISDPEEVVSALSAFDTMGAMTPNTAIQMANEYFDLQMPKVKEEWGNWPFPIVQAYANAGRLKGVDGIADPMVDPAAFQGKQNGNGATSGDPQQHEAPTKKKAAEELMLELIRQSTMKSE